MRRLFVRSGGGMPGLDIHTGIWQALTARGIEADACIGTSAGAIVSAMDAAGITSARARDIIEAQTDATIRRERFAWKIRIPWIDHWLSPDPIRDLLAGLLPERFSDLAKGLRVCCTRVEDGGRMTFSADQGNPWLRESVLASMSISGVFPWVSIGGTYYADGGVRANVPLPDDWAAFDEVWLLIATRPTFYRVDQRGLLSRVMLNVDWLMADQIYDVLATTNGAHNVRVVWPNVGARSGALHFDHSLIDEARIQTDAILKLMNAGKR